MLRLALSTPMTKSLEVLRPSARRSDITSRAATKIAAHLERDPEDVHRVRTTLDVVRAFHDLERLAEEALRFVGVRVEGDSREHRERKRDDRRARGCASRGDRFLRASPGALVLAGPEEQVSVRV